MEWSESSASAAFPRTSHVQVAGGSLAGNDASLLSSTVASPPGKARSLASIAPLGARSSAVGHRVAVSLQGRSSIGSQTANGRARDQRASCVTPTPGRRNDFNRRSRSFNAIEYRVRALAQVLDPGAFDAGVVLGCFDLVHEVCDVDLEALLELLVRDPSPPRRRPCVLGRARTCPDRGAHRDARTGCAAPKDRGCLRPSRARRR